MKTFVKDFMDLVVLNNHLIYSALQGIIWNIPFVIVISTSKYVVNFKSKNCSLLLLLMKIQMGVSFAVVGTLFAIYKTTAARIFLNVLDKYS